MQRRWADWLAAMVLAGAALGLLVLAVNLWRVDRLLELHGVHAGAEITGLREEGGHRATVRLRLATPAGPVVIQRRVGAETRAGWRVGDRVEVRYLPGRPAQAEVVAERDPGYRIGALGAVVLLAAGGWMRWLVRPPRARRLVADERMFAAARRLMRLSGPEANAWLARDDELLAVHLGDTAEDIVASWNRTVGRHAPIGHGFAPERPAEALPVVHALARAVARELPLRFCRDSWGGSTLSFIALTPAQWQALDREFGSGAVAQRFAPVPEDLETFQALAMEQPPPWVRRA